MKALVVTITLLFAAGCSSPSVSSGARAREDIRYVCYVFENPLEYAEHVLTLPAPPMNWDNDKVIVFYKGEMLEANYMRSGLKEWWFLPDRYFFEIDSVFWEEGDELVAHRMVGISTDDCGYPGPVECAEPVNVGVYDCKWQYR